MYLQKRRYFLSLVVLVFFLFGATGSLVAQFIAPEFSIYDLGGGYGEANGLTFNADGSRMFVWEKAGIVHVSNWNATTRLYDVQSTPVLNISEEVGNWGDFGLVGFAIDPNYASNGYIYLFYVVDRHYLLYHGTAQYNPSANEYNNATIGRITRYTTYVNGSNQLVADPASRKILLGESITTGIPITHDSHGVGSLIFADDGTLLASAGDGASYDGIDTGSNSTTYYATALADGILRPEENVGAYRAQMINSLNGKILRLDPATGNGIASNPFYDPARPRAAQSRVWALGFRNPFRFIHRPGSGSTNPATGDLGEIYIGDVGWNKWEEINIINQPGVNAGWPIYEGFFPTEIYPVNKVINRDEPNPLYGTNGCTQQYYYFNNLLKQPTADNNKFLPNPCDPSVDVVHGNSNRFIHQRPSLAYYHAGAATYTYVGIFNGNDPDVATLGSAESGVSGTPFQGNCAAGACWFAGNRYGNKYNGTYFFCDFAGGWMKNISLSTPGQIGKVENFGQNVGAIISMEQSPKDSLAYMINYYNNRVLRLAYGGNIVPVAAFSSNINYGTAPLSVNFDAGASFDPDNGTLTYTWDFGDGNSGSGKTPSHVFGTAGDVNPASYTVKLTVTDNQGGSTVVTHIVSVNNQPPVVSIISPANNAYYTTGSDSTYTLSANVSDDQSDSELKYQWQTVLRHNTHEHREPVDTNHVTSSTIARVGCNGDTYYYYFSLTVTDPYGLSTTDSVKIYPACALVPPEITTQPQSETVCANDTVSLISAVFEAPAPPVVWQESVDDGNSWTNIDTAINPNFKFVAAAEMNGYKYRAAWTNAAGTVYSDASTLTVNSIPDAPTGESSQLFCGPSVVADLQAIGSSIAWYDVAEAGTALSAADSLADGMLYYATQTISGCESHTRLAVTARINRNESAVTLNGSQSSGDINAYLWSLVSGPNTPLIETPDEAVTRVSGLVEGNYVFQLSLNGGSSSSLVTVSVNPSDSLLQANAGNDRFIRLPQSSVTLNGGGSSGPVSSYEWHLISGPSTPSIEAADQVNASVSDLQEGSYQFELVLSDGSATSKDTVVITVLPASSSANSPVIALTSTNHATGNASSNTLNGVPAGAMLVLAIAQSDDQTTDPNAVVSSSPGLTWIKRADAQAIGSGNAEIYTALFGAGGNITVNTNWGVNGMSTVLYAITNFSSSNYGAIGTASLQLAPQVSIASSQDNSLLIGASSDWNASNGAARTYRDAAVETDYYYRSGLFTAYQYYKMTAAQGTYVEGLTNPSDMKAGTAILEIRGALQAAPALADAGSNMVLHIGLPPSATPDQAFCAGALLSDLSASGNEIKWYSVDSAGSPLSLTDSLIDGQTYYASQTVYGCEVQDRTAVLVTLHHTDAPEADSTQHFCEGGVIADLEATGSAIKWYDAAEAGNALSGADSLESGRYYYASQTLDACESEQRLPVLVTIGLPDPASITQTDNCDSTFTLTAVGGGSVLWSTGDTSTSIIADTLGTYTVTRIEDGCSSMPDSVTVTPVLLKLSAIVTQPVCEGDTGMVVLEASGGGGSFTFGNTPVSGLSSGSYHYTVTDNNGCTKELTVQIGVQVAVWTGAVDTNWHNAANWDTGSVPDSVTHVIIPATSNPCVISTGNAVAASVQAKTGASYRVENGFKLTITGNCDLLPAAD